MAFGAKIKLSVNTSGASAFRNEIQRYVNTATRDNPIVLSKFAVRVSNPKTLIKDIQSQFNSANGGITVKVNDINAKGAISKLRSELETMLSGLTVGGLQAFLGTDGIANGIDGAIEKQEQLAQAAKKVEENAIREKAALQELSRIQSTLTSSFTNISKFGATDTTESLSEYERLNARVQELRVNESARSAEAIQGLAQEAIALRQKTSIILETEKATKRAADEQAEADTKNIASAQQVMSLKAQINRYVLSNSKAYKVYGAEIDALMGRLQSESKLSKAELSEIRTTFIGIQDSARSAGVAGNTFFDTLKKGWEKFGGWSLVTRSMMAAYRVIKEMIGAVKDLDAAMTELKKVTDLTETAYENFLETATKMAKAVGASLSDTVNAVADFARLGYTVSESTALAEAALVYQNVGDGIDDVSVATESLISTIKAFGIEAEEAMGIVDRFNEVGNHFAISSEGIGTALQKSASSLASANNSLEESIALVTAMNSVIQNPEIVGTALKTVSMYLRAAKTEAEEAGESTDGMANSVSELRGELLKLTNGKVDIMIDDSTFKSTYEIFKELSEVWDELSDIDTANILELIGGKRNATAITSLITNFEDAEAALITASDAAGSALAENEKYLDSISGKIDQFTAAFESLSSNIIDSTLVKNVVDFGTGLMNVLDSLQQAKLLLPLIVASIATIRYYQLGKHAQETAIQITTLVNRFVAEKTATDSLVASYWTLTKAQQQEVLTKLQAQVASGALTQAHYNEITAKLGLTAATIGAKTATDALNVSIKSLLLSNPVGWIMLAVSLVPTLINLFTSLHKSNEELIEDANELKEAYTSEITETTNSLSTLRGMESEFETLSRGVGEYGENISLTADEYERYQEIVSTILGVTPELIAGYDAEGNAIANKNGLLQKSIELMEEEQRLAKQKIVGDDNLWTIAKGAIAEYEDKLDEIDDISMPNNLGWSGVKIDKNGKRETGYVNQIDKYIEDVIGVEFTGWEGGIQQYIAQNADAVYSNIGAILERAGEDFTDEAGNTWEGLSESQIESLEEYLTQIKYKVDDLEDINNEFSETLQIIPQTLSSYYDLDNSEKDFITRYVDTFKINAETTKQEIEQMSADIEEFVDSFASDDQLRAVVNVGIKLDADAQSEELSVAAYRNKIQSFIKSIDDLSEEQQVIVKSVFKIEDDENQWRNELDDKVNRVKAILKDEFDDEVELMTMSELELAYSISAEQDSLTFDELKQLIAEIGFEGANMLDVLDFSDMTSSLDDIVNGIDNIVSSMEKLRDGTSLTKVELAKLALEYPKLLEEANLFTDETIEGQNAILDNLLNNYESEYDATIDAKIAELKAANECLNAQAELEAQKTNLLLEIKTAEVNGKIESEEWLQGKIREFNDLQGRNYVSMQNGILEVNEAALNAQMQAASDGANATTDVWGQSASQVTTFYENTASAAVQSTQIAVEKSKSIFEKIGDWFKKFWNAVKSLFSGNGWDFSLGDTGVDTSVDITVDLDDKGNYEYNSIDNKAIDDWVSGQEKAVSERLDQIKKQYDTNLQIINNLENLKGLNLTDLYGSSSKDATSKEIEEYIADIDAYYDALKRLEKAQALRASIDKQLENTDDPKEKIALERQLIEAYKQEAEAEANLMSLKSQTIAANAQALRELGFAVNYNSETNELYIANLEHLNDLVATSCGEYETLDEATNALRKSTEELIDVTETLNDDNQESAETIEDITYAIGDSKDNIIGYISEMAEEAKESLESITSVYETLRSAVESYNKNGYLTVDMFQSIMDLGTEYLSFLYDENGAIKFNEEAIQQLIAAKIENLAVTKAMALVDTVKEYKDDAEALKGLADATYQATDATWGLVYANLAAIGLDDDMYTAFLHQIQTIQQLAASAKENIGASFGSFGSDASSAYNDASNSLEDYYNEASDALDYILDKTQELIEYEVEQQVEAIQKQIDAYKELIDLKKEALEQTKAEEDYEESVAEKVKDIAELQAKIDQLSLDNSREAQAERNTLMAELAEKQKDLADTQDDHAHDAQIDALDKLSSAYEDEKQTEIEILENSISSTEKIYQLAIQRIQDNWSTLYQELINWNMVAGNDINANITENWIKAAQAVQTYGSYVQAVASVQAGLEQTSSTQGNTIGNTIPRYHSGGVVDGDMSEEEVLAILEEGELVLNEQKKNSLYEIVDFQSELSKRLGVTLGSVKLSTIPLNVLNNVDNLPESVDNSSKLVFEPHIEVTIHHNGGVSDSEAQDYGEQIADITIDKLYSAFERKGINSIRSATLKP